MTAQQPAELTDTLDMLEQMRKTVKRYRMLRSGDRVLVAVSGGVDSVVLLYALQELQEKCKLSLGVAHFDHAIRADSAEDARFVAQLADKLKLACYTERSDVPAYAIEKKLSREVAARELRYRFLEKTAKARKFNKIALGHNLNDQAETLLMRLLRGAGLEGLSGIPPVRPADEARRAYIRPLLECTRAQIEAFARERRLTWREDPSNRDLAILRNSIRHELIPCLIRDYNPNLLAMLGRTSQLLAQAAHYLGLEAGAALITLIRDRQPDELTLDLEGLLQYPEFLQSLLLRQAIANVSGLSEWVHIDATLQWLARRGTGELQLAAGVRLLRRHDQLVVTVRPTSHPERFAYPLAVPGAVTIPDIGWCVEASLCPPLPPTLSPVGAKHASPLQINIDADKIVGALVVRNRRPGDRIRLPVGSKKLQDFFVNEKIPREARDAIPLICDAGKVIWIIGWGVDEDYRTTARTNRTVRICARRLKGAL